MPGGKELRGDSGIRSVDALHKLATLWTQGEIKKLPKVPILKFVFDRAIADLNTEAQNSKSETVQPL